MVVFFKKVPDLSPSNVLEEMSHLQVTAINCDGYVTDGYKCLMFTAAKRTNRSRGVF